jgi:hypothetical protein
MASALKKYPTYPIGRPGHPWNAEEKLQWLRSQTKVRDYFSDVLSDFFRLDKLDFFSYGQIDCRGVVADEGRFKGAVYPLFAGKSKNWDATKRLIVVSSYVHGYEPTTKAINLFMEKYYAEFANAANFLFLPAVSPWAVEADNRWTPAAIDPNRCFNPKEPGCDEARLAMQCVFDVEKTCGPILMHIDLHTTPDLDNTKMTPMKLARDGKLAENEKFEEIPPGFYLVQSDYNAQPAFQKAMIDAVEKITRIAVPDENGEIIGEKVTGHGIITIPGRSWNLCGAFTNAPYSTTTEVYPDDKSNPEYPDGLPQELCDEAQATCIAAGVRYALANELPPVPSA